MFVTKRGLSDACNVVGKQLDQVSESVHVSFFVLYYLEYSDQTASRFQMPYCGIVVKLRHKSNQSSHSVTS
jgi:hypothetical protein